MRPISALGIVLLLVVSLFSWAAPVSAGATVWSAETIPSQTGNMLGPAGIDIIDLAVGGDGTTIYAVPRKNLTVADIGMKILNK